MKQEIALEAKPQEMTCAQDAPVIYFIEQENKKEEDFLFFEESFIETHGWKLASQKGRRLWRKIKVWSEQMSIDAFAGDRFIRKLGKFRKIIILLNEPIDPAIVKARLARILVDRSYHHLRWMIVDIVLLPFTFFTMFLPGPNVPFFYLAFRIYSHWKGYRSASLSSLEDMEVRVSGDAREVNAFLRNFQDMRTALQELRKKYGLRALQEQKFIPQFTALKESWKKIRQTTS